MKIKRSRYRFFTIIICLLLYMVQPLKAAEYVYYSGNQNEQQSNHLVSSYGSTNQISVGVPFQLTLVATKYEKPVYDAMKAVLLDEGGGAMAASNGAAGLGGTGLIPCSEMDPYFGLSRRTVGCRVLVVANLKQCF